jgi:5-methylcytosine-specific restriction enzyme subunit McrC
MRYVGPQTIYPCAEYEAVEIPIERLLGPDGRLRIYPEVTAKGFFDVDYRDGRLVLKSTRYVGLIPINDHIAIHVRPRAAIGNLMRMIERSGTQVSGLSGFIRGYQEQYGAVDDPEQVYLGAFTTALARVSEAGILKRYVTRSTDREWRGRLLLGETVGRFRSRGISQRAMFEVHDLTEDNDENRILKHTAERLLRHLVVQQTNESRNAALRLKGLLRPFAAVDSGSVNSEYVARVTPSIVRGLPRSHHFYEPVLWLAYLICTDSGVSLEEIGPARFETVILDAADVFERYLRTLIQDAAAGPLRGYVVLDGNTRSVPLFFDRQTPPTKPDYYFLRGGKPVALADAKYKPALSAPDRYELLSFCEALAVNNAAFLVPAFPGQDLTQHHGTTAGGRVITVVRIDLAARDIEAEEAAFIDRLATALSLT